MSIHSTSTTVLTCLRCVAAFFALFFIAITAPYAGSRLSEVNPASKNTVTETDTASIVVSIKPLYSLVAQLTAGIETPALLMRQAQSPHHYNIRPSERRLLANAKMIIWLGPEMELALSKIIGQSSASVLTVMQAKDLNLLESRAKHSDHDNHASEKSGSTSQQLESHRIDPHIWLSTHNAIAISKYVTQQLIAHDASNTEKYQSNLTALIIRIEHTARLIKTTLKDTSQPFIAYHDAFQYFEKENGLNFIAALSTDDETSVSLKYMHEITGEIENKKINCLVYQPPKPAIVDTLASKHKMNLAMLDILGLTLSDDKNAWFEIMQLLATNFNQCLSEK